jgi:hypothetical protein
MEPETRIFAMHVGLGSAHTERGNVSKNTEFTWISSLMFADAALRISIVFVCNQTYFCVRRKTADLVLPNKIDFPLCRFHE